MTCVQCAQGRRGESEREREARRVSRQHWAVYVFKIVFNLLKGAQNDKATYKTRSAVTRNSWHEHFVWHLIQSLYRTFVVPCRRFVREDSLNGFTKSVRASIKTSRRFVNTIPVSVCVCVCCLYREAKRYPPIRRRII